MTETGEGHPSLGVAKTRSGGVALALLSPPFLGQKWILCWLKLNDRQMEA